MEFNYNQLKDVVECSHIETPSLNKSRMDHSCIIVNDYLFVLFGMKDDQTSAFTAEYLDLLDPKITEAEFHDLKMPEEGLNLRNVMLFEDFEYSLFDLQKKNGYKRFFFFGGNDLQGSRRNANALKITKLYELMISWDTSKDRVRPSGLTIKVVDGVTFEGNPSFNS